MTAIATTTLPLPLAWRGKVRDVYSVDDERVLLVTTDRISAFDVVMREAVPYKGAVLTQLTAWWLTQLESQVPHHMITADADEIAREVPALDGSRDALRLRAMLCRRVRIVPIECVIRGYITGSAWKEYKEHGTLAGEMLPAGLKESERLTPALFSPATNESTKNSCGSRLDFIFPLSPGKQIAFFTGSASVCDNQSGTTVSLETPATLDIT